MGLTGIVNGGGNNSNAQNVFKVVFNAPTSFSPILQAWDDENLSTTDKSIFAGTFVNGYVPLISAIATREAVPDSDWKPLYATSGGNVVNRLKGGVYYVNLLSTGIINPNDYVLFNLNWELPSDLVLPPVDSLDHSIVLVIKYSYSGDAPVLSWYFNDQDAGGTENDPVWCPISIGTTVYPIDSATILPVIKFTRPESGVRDCPYMCVVS